MRTQNTKEILKIEEKSTLDNFFLENEKEFINCTK